MAVEKGGVKVGLCKQHFRERLEELKSEGWLDDLRDELNTDRIE